MNPASYSTELLIQARALAATAGGDETREAGLRRSISSAYYAVFHFLVGEACVSLLGDGEDRAEARMVLGRAFDHVELRLASELFLTKSPDGARERQVDPAVLKTSLNEETIPRALSMFAGVFADLYRERQLADYELSAPPDEADVLGLIDRAEAAIRGWTQIRDHPATRLYTLCLFNLKRMRGANRG